jgi:hypothetical protein
MEGSNHDLTSGTQGTDERHELFIYLFLIYFMIFGPKRDEVTVRCVILQVYSWQHSLINSGAFALRLGGHVCL